jgi:hypothetical protein
VEKVRERKATELAAIRSFKKPGRTKFLPAFLIICKCKLCSEP